MLVRVCYELCEYPFNIAKSVTRIVCGREGATVFLASTLQGSESYEQLPVQLLIWQAIQWLCWMYWNFCRAECPSWAGIQCLARKTAIPSISSWMERILLARNRKDLQGISVFLSFITDQNKRSEPRRAIGNHERFERFAVQVSEAAPSDSSDKSRGTKWITLVKLQKLFRKQLRCFARSITTDSFRDLEIAQSGFWTEKDKKSYENSRDCAY